MLVLSILFKSFKNCFSKRRGVPLPFYPWLTQIAARLAATIMCLAIFSTINTNSSKFSSNYNVYIISFKFIPYAVIKTIWKNCFQYIHPVSPSSLLNWFICETVFNTLTLWQLFRLENIMNCLHKRFTNVGWWWLGGCTISWFNDWIYIILILVLLDLSALCDVDTYGHLNVCMFIICISSVWENFDYGWDNWKRQHMKTFWRLAL